MTTDPPPLLDTHTTIWYLARDSRLSANALATIQDAIASGHRCLVSAVSIAEMRYLVDKGKLEEEKVDKLIVDLQEPTFPLAAVSFDLDCADKMKEISRDIVPDMPDRMLAATALRLGIRLVTRDANIRRSQVVTVW